MHLTETALIAMLVMAFAWFVFGGLGLGGWDHAAMNICEKHHSHSTCVYALLR